MSLNFASPLTLPRTRIVPAIVAVAFFMQMLDGTIIATSLPAMAATFDTDVVTLNIGFTVYLLAMAVFIPPAGWLADRFGAKQVFLSAIALFTLSSIACGLSQTLGEFTVARLVQGASAALMTPVGRQLVLRDTPKSELVGAIATITWPALIAPVIGPLVGGWMTTHAGWEWNFFINIPLGLIGVTLVAIFVPRVPAEEPRPFDIPGFLLTTAGLGSTLAGLEILSSGNAGLGGVALLLLGFGAGVLAAKHLKRATNPLFDMSILNQPTFALATLWAGTAGRMAINSTPFLLPLLFQVGLGLDAVETGSLILIYFFGNLMMKSVTTPALRLFGFRYLLVINGIAAAISIGAFALVDSQTPRVVLYGLLFICGLFRSMQFTSLTAIAFADVTPSQRNAATGISSMLQQLSQLLGIAVAVGAIRLSTYLHGDTAEGGSLADIRIALLVVAAIGLYSALRFLGLAPDAGAEVSGQTRR